MNQGTGLDADKIALYRQDDGSWVAEVPAIARRYALIGIRKEALAELGYVFDTIADECLEKSSASRGHAEIVNA